MNEFKRIENQISNCNNLDELFVLWKNAHLIESDWEKTTYTHSTLSISGIEQDSFIKDGYINYEEYNIQQAKILFILKEANTYNYRSPNVPPSERDQIKEYDEYLTDGKTNRPKQHEKMGRMAYFLHNKDINIEKAKRPETDEIKFALKTSAFMNLNKRGGKANTTEKYYAYIEKYEKFIMRQIQILNPNHIIILGDSNDKITNNISNNYRSITIKMWHTAYNMRYNARDPRCNFGSDQNVDCFMREFFERAQLI